MRPTGQRVPNARASVEMAYQSTVRFIVDSSQVEKFIGLKPAAVDVGSQRTEDSYNPRLTSAVRARAIRT